MKIVQKALLLAIAVLAVAAGCAPVMGNNPGDGAGTGIVFTPGTDTSPKTGVFMDAEVSGLAYVCSPSGVSGITDAHGRYNYKEGDTVSFSLGGITLNTVSVTAQAVLTPLSLVGGAGLVIDDTTAAQADVRATNIVRLLMSFDADSDPSNGITIDAETRNAIQGVQTSLESALGSATFADFNSAIATVISAVSTATGSTVTVETPTAAQTHYADSKKTPILSIVSGSVTSGTKVTVGAIDSATAFEYQFGATTGSWTSYPAGGIPVEGAVGAVKQLYVQAVGNAATIRDASYAIVAMPTVSGLAVQDLPGTATRELVVSWDRNVVGDVVISGSNGIVETVVPNSYTSVKISLLGINIHEMKIFVRDGANESVPLHFLAIALPRFDVKGRYSFVFDAQGKIEKQKLYFANNYLLGISMQYDATPGARPVSYGILPLGLSYGKSVRVELTHSTADAITEARVLEGSVTMGTVDLSYANGGIAAAQFGTPSMGPQMRLSVETDAYGKVQKGNVSTNESGTWNVMGHASVAYSGSVASELVLFNQENTEMGRMGVSSPDNKHIRLTMSSTGGNSQIAILHDESAAFFEFVQSADPGLTPQNRSVMKYDDSGLQTLAQNYRWDVATTAWKLNSYQEYLYNGTSQLTQIGSYNYDESASSFVKSSETAFVYYSNGKIDTETHTFLGSIPSTTVSKYDETTGNIVSEISDYRKLFYKTAVAYKPDYCIENWKTTGAETYTKWFDNAAGVCERFEQYRGTVDDSTKVSQKAWFNTPSNNYYQISELGRANRIEYFDLTDYAHPVCIATAAFASGGWNPVTATFVYYSNAATATALYTKTYAFDAKGSVVSMSCDVAATNDYAAFNDMIKNCTAITSTLDLDWIRGESQFRLSGANPTAMVQGFDYTINSTYVSDPMFGSLMKTQTMTCGGTICASLEYEATPFMGGMKSASCETVGNPADRWKVERTFDNSSGPPTVTVNTLYQWVGGVWQAK